MHFRSKHFGGRHFAAAHFGGAAVAEDPASPWEWRAAPGTEVKKPPKEPAEAAVAVAEPTATRPDQPGLDRLVERKLAEAQADASQQAAIDAQKAAEAKRGAQEAAEAAERARLQALDEQALLSGELLLPLYRAYRAQRLKRYLSRN